MFRELQCYRRILKTILWHVCEMLRQKCPYSEFSGPYFPVFGLSMERYGVSLRIQSKYGKIRTRKTPNTDTLHTDNNSLFLQASLISCLVLLATVFYQDCNKKNHFNAKHNQNCQDFFFVTILMHLSLRLFYLVGS